jgi:hypothetical protein
MNHIGDVFFSASFIKNICINNPDKYFYYYTILGDTFFDGISNIRRLNINEDKYKSFLFNGSAPEDILNDQYTLNLLRSINNRDKFNIMSYNNEQVLFINTWCSSIGFSDFDYLNAINAWKTYINMINKQFNLDLKHTLSMSKELLLPEKLNQIPKYIESILDGNNDKQIYFVYNFVCRSLDFDMNKLYNYVDKLADNNIVILASKNITYKLKNNNNIYICDIEPDPHCINLQVLWQIAKKCNNVIILPCGATWLFINNKLINLDKTKLLMFNNQYYTDKLNNNIKHLLDTKDNYIVNINSV